LRGLLANAWNEENEKMGVGSGDRPGYNNIELGSQAAADKGKKGFGVGKNDGGSVGGWFLRLQLRKPDPNLA
jgi:hypothetical protein